jgi:hypothetical protein
MACIIKLPGKSKGIVTFTTIELNRVYSSEEHDGLLGDMKEDWVIGMHYNSPQPEHPSIFDFAITAPNFVDDLNGRKLIPIDAGRLAPPCFGPTSREKHWDVLSVSRCTHRKNVEFFMKAIKKLYNSGYEYRVLLVTTVPERQKERYPSDPEGMYMDLFTKEERNRFTFLPLYHDLPFPFDRDTLAEFFKSSRVFVHPATAEGGRIRNAGYAWASEMPVVGMNLFHPDLEEHGLKHPPTYYEAESYDEIPDRIIDAVEDYHDSIPDLRDARELFSITYTADRLRSEFRDLFQQLGEDFTDEKFYLDDIDVRIARHHGMESATRNEFACSFSDFLKELRDPEQIEAVIESSDPEENVARALFGRTFGTDPDEKTDIELPTPASERTTPREKNVELLRHYNLYPLAKMIYDWNPIARKIYNELY